MYVTSVATSIVVGVILYDDAPTVLHCAIVLHVVSPNLNHADMD